MITLYPHNYAEMLAALACSISFALRRTILNKNILLLSILTVIVEITAKSFGINPFKYLLFNIFVLVELLCYSILFLKLAEGKKRIVFIASACILAEIFGIVNMIAGQGPFVYNNYTRMTISICVTFCALIVLYNFSNRGIFFSRAKDYPASIFIVALIFFYSGNFFNYHYFSLMIDRNPENAVYLYKVINHTLNVMMYGSFAVAFSLEVFSLKRVLS